MIHLDYSSLVQQSQNFKCVTAASSVRHTTPSPHTAEVNGSPGAQQATLTSAFPANALSVCSSHEVGNMKTNEKISVAKHENLIKV